ncbi:hypothetical protein WHR41_07905 [Cladosporium halotolerans]|uniref:SGT1-domain-containing protein n=1 Tax=Cladosporium halotolerans TaxID=1052096 RepID=A0AB34KE30_9PEZI
MEPSQDDGFKWFGEGFEGFPKRLPEDCVEYAIYVVDEEIKTTAQLLAKLNEILKFANEAGKKLFKDYIWQRDEFALKINPDITKQNAATTTTSNSSDQKALPDNNTNTPLHLLGRTNFGDSIADEWLIVHFLLTLSTHFPTAWMRVHDSDGEFLLIEAASALPKWLNPDVADNRVWLNNGHLRIIPPSATSPNTKPHQATNLTLPTALTTILTAPSTLTISPYIEDEAFARTRAYPASIASTFHHTILPLPRKLALVLQRLPAAIAPAIEAFYLRDPVSLRPLMARDARALRFPPEDFVRTSVKVPRVGFAQLRGQVFAAPPAWAGLGGKGMENEKWSMGMKLACGFEMMLADEGAFGDRRVVREVGVLVGDVESGEEGLPGDGEVEGWGMREDGEEWLDVDYGDFEEELAGKKGKGGKRGGKAGGFGDVGAQENLRRMVRRFEEFAEGDDEAGLEGVGEDDDVDDEDEDDDSSVSSSGEDKDGSFDEAEFERAMKEMMGMPAADIEKSGLLEEARRLALEDEKEGDGRDDMDEDEETRKVMELMEKELKGHGALNLNNEKQKKSKASGEPDKPYSKAAGKKPTFFGPERPPGMVATTKQFEEEADEEIGPGDGELSSDDEDYNDVDLGLAQNMLEAFKGQAGMSGPAGNMMRAMGVNLPRDEGED